MDEETMDEEKKQPTCETCPFWQRSITYPGDGICRRHAPLATIFDDPTDNFEAYPTWPVTTDIEWCGEHPDFPAWLAGRKAPDGPDSEPIEWLFDPAEGRLTTRAHRVLESAGVLTVGDLRAMSAHQLLGLKTFGRKTLKFVRGRLAERGMSLRGDRPPKANAP